MTTVASPLDDVRGAAAAVSFIEHAYWYRLRRHRTATHLLAVGELLARDGQPPTIVVAGLLHDVLEDTDTPAPAVEERFGVAVASIVSALTQDASIDDYAERKAALRRRTVNAGPGAAAVALADKITKLEGRTKPPKPRKLTHYRATLDEIEAQFGRSDLSDRLRGELARWD